ncbi:MAG: sugar phosphate isomerase/epimerase [Halobacteriota archaeon]|nr:sugar phosphate isomerase/epimerase [Halobacteriota archaeon]
MKLSISTWSLSHCPINYNIKNIKECGFENIEFNISAINAEAGDSVYTVKRLIDEYDLNCSSVHSEGFYVERKDQIEEALFLGKKSVDFAHLLSSENLVIHSYVSAKAKTDLRKYLLEKIIGDLKEYADERGVKLSLENLSRGSKGYGRNVSELLNIFDIVDVGMTVDFCHSCIMYQAHTFLDAFKTLSFLDVFKDKITNIHMSNYNHRPILKMTPEIDRMLTTLYQNGYDGMLTIEQHPKFREDIMNTKKCIEEWIELHI